MRAVIAEDLALLRDGLIRLLTAHDIEVVAAVRDGPSVLSALLEHRPDVAAVSYTHLDVYKRQGSWSAGASRTSCCLSMSGP